MRRQGAARSKFGNRKTVVDGVTFDSAAESRHYQKLKLMVKAGMIRDLALQPEFVLIAPFRDQDGKLHRATKYRADFSYVAVESGRLTIEEIKGTETAVWKIKEKLFRSRFPEIQLIVVKV